MIWFCVVLVLVVVCVSLLSRLTPEFKVGYKLLNENGRLPTQAYLSDAGFDVYAADDVLVDPGAMRPVPTGIVISAPEGYYFSVRGRSGLARRHSISVFDGTIDAHYFGELIVTLINHGSDSYKVHKGDRIAQIVFHRCHKPLWEKVTFFRHDSAHRADNGFGSSGV